MRTTAQIVLLSFFLGSCTNPSNSSQAMPKDKWVKKAELNLYVDKNDGDHSDFLIVLKNDSINKQKSEIDTDVIWINENNVVKKFKNVTSIHYGPDSIIIEPVSMNMYFHSMKSAIDTLFFNGRATIIINDDTLSILQKDCEPNLNHELISWDDSVAMNYSFNGSYQRYLKEKEMINAR